MAKLHPPPAVPDHDVQWGIVDAVLVVLGAHIMASLWVGAVQGAGLITADGGPYPVVELAVAGVGLWAGFVLGPVWVARARGRGPLADYGLAVRPVDVPLGIGTALITNLALLPALYQLVGLVWDADPEASARDQVSVLDGFGQWMLFALLVAVVVPIVEELAYRGLLLRALQRRLGPVAALLISSAVFAFFHAGSGWIVVPGIFVFALGAGALALWTGRIGPAVAMHMAFNGTTLLVLSPVVSG